MWKSLVVVGIVAEHFSKAQWNEESYFSSLLCLAISRFCYFGALLDIANEIVIGI